MARIDPVPVDHDHPATVLREHHREVRRSRRLSLERARRRHDDCPVHGARSIRLPNGRFRLEITDELVLPRDQNGDVDIRGTTELVTRVVEGWVREYPEQWLWMHRRWKHDRLRRFDMLPEEPLPAEGED